MSKLDITPAFYRLSELATSPAKPAKTYTDPQGRVRNISARPANKGVTPLGASTILKYERLGLFPKAIRSIQGITVWSASSVHDWLKSLETAANDEGV